MYIIIQGIMIAIDAKLPMLINSNSTPSASSRKQLEIQNKTFFLHLPKLKNISQLERELTTKGGKVTGTMCV